MRSKVMYAVMFVGYSAKVIANKSGVEIDFAFLDFVSGHASLFADGGWVSVPSHDQLRPFVNRLPEIVSELEDLLKELASSSDREVVRGPYSATKNLSSSGREMISVTCAPGSEIYLSPSTHFRPFIRKILKRYAKVERVLGEAEKIGNSINRRPYDDYIDEIAKTGFARVEYYGSALLLNGALRFRPERRTVLARPQDDGRIVELHEITRVVH